MRHLDGCRHAVQHDNLVAPVELVGLTGCVIERHIGFCRNRAALLRPFAGITPDGIVAAFVTLIAQIFIYPDERQLFARWLGNIGEQYSIELVLPRSKLRARLRRALIGERCLTAAQNLPYHFTRNAQFPADRFDRLALRQGKPAYLRNCFHNKHPNKKPPR